MLNPMYKSTRLISSSLHIHTSFLSFVFRIPEFEAGGGDRDARSAARDSGSEHKHGGGRPQRRGVVCAPLFRDAERPRAFAFVHAGRGGGAGAAGAGEARLDERVQRAMDYFAVRPTEPFSLAPLARHCGLSASRFSHLFREQTGETPQVYAEELRLRLPRGTMDKRSSLQYRMRPMPEVGEQLGERYEPRIPFREAFHGRQGYCFR